MKTRWSSRKRSILVYQYISSALGREFKRGNRVHVCARGQTVGEKKNVGVPVGDNRVGAKPIDADRDADPEGRVGDRKAQRTLCRDGVHAWHWR